MGYASCSSQPIKNGDFEQGIEFWLRSGVEAAISDAHVHSGRYALRTYGGSAWQTVNVEPPLNPVLRFWIYLSSVYGTERGKTDAAITITIISSSFEKNISYYVSGPNREANDTKIILTGELQRDQWIFVERNLREDFTKYYKTIRIDDVQKIKIKIWSYPTSDPIPFWDDISLEYSEAPKTPTPPTPTVTPTPTRTPTPTTPKPPPTTVPEKTPTPPPTFTGILTETYMLPIFAIVIAAVLVGGLVIFRRQKLKAREKAPHLPQLRRPIDQAAGVIYCLNCGEQLKPDSRYCTKCGSATSG
ncbi:zinc-ribbon domain-containing protein [Candidatus Bathyarchaeota archaeon]|nr:zinc-ribbon domain-containing protein [Candidatus Bathyarchaeota archaeon]